LTNFGLGCGISRNLLSRNAKLQQNTEIKLVTQYYRIQPEQEQYMEFKLDSFDFLDKLGEKYELSDLGKPIQHDWLPIKGKFYPRVNATKAPDITTWQTNFLVLNQKAFDALKVMLEALGELLPLEVESDTYYLFNPLVRLPDEAIDLENSEYEYHQTEEEPVGFKVLNFNAANIPEDKPLFCVQNDFAYNLYCDERFRKLVSENGLNGLYFNTTLIEPYFK